MNWISLLLLVLRYLPTIIQLVREIMGAIDSLQDPAAKRQASLELKEAVNQARRFGNRKPLRNLLARLTQLREEA